MNNVFGMRMGVQWNKDESLSWNLGVKDVPETRQRNALRDTVLGVLSGQLGDYQVMTALAFCAREC